MDAWSEEIIDICDDPTLEPNDRRIRIETRRWLMSKLSPRYADKLVHAGDAEKPIRHVVAVASIDRLSAPELDALERFTAPRLAAKDAADQSDGDG